MIMAHEWDAMNDEGSMSLTASSGPVIKMCRAKVVDENTGVAKSGTIAEFCFVPAGCKPMTVKELEDIVADKWNLGQANMLISCDAGNMHPKSLATKKLSSQPQFDEWMRQSEAQLRKTKTDTDAIDLSNPDTLMEQSNIVINQLIFQRLLTIFSAVLDAASLSNNWIIINRANPQGSSATSEFMLELAMQQTSQRPVVVVIESLNRLRRYTNEDSEHQIRSLNNLLSLGVPVEKYQKAEFEPVKFASSYDIEEFDNYTDWLEDVVGDLPAKPHKSDLQPMTGKVNDRARWSYHVSGGRG